MGIDEITQSLKILAVLVPVVFTHSICCHSSLAEDRGQPATAPQTNRILFFLTVGDLPSSHLTPLAHSDYKYCWSDQARSQWGDWLMHRSCLTLHTSPAWSNMSWATERHSCNQIFSVIYHTWDKLGTNRHIFIVDMIVFNSRQNISLSSSWQVV